MIAIIDYEAGNLKSVYNAFEAIEHTPKVISDPNDLRTGQYLRGAISPRKESTEWPSPFKKVS